MLLEVTFRVYFQTVNIADAYLDPRFDPSVDEGTGFKHNTILCMAIKNSEGRIIGVIQVSCKFNGNFSYFTLVLLILKIIVKYVGNYLKVV